MTCIKNHFRGSYWQKSREALNIGEIVEQSLRCSVAVSFQVDCTVHADGLRALSEGLCVTVSRVQLPLLLAAAQPAKLTDLRQDIAANAHAFRTSWYGFYLFLSLSLSLLGHDRIIKRIVKHYPAHSGQPSRSALPGIESARSQQIRPASPPSHPAIFTSKLIFRYNSVLGRLCAVMCTCAHTHTHSLCLRRLMVRRWLDC